MKYVIAVELSFVFMSNWIIINFNGLHFVVLFMGNKETQFSVKFLKAALKILVREAKRPTFIPFLE